MSNLEKINVLTKAKLDSLDMTQYPNQIFGTTDEVTESNEAIEFAESERQKTLNLFDGNFRQGKHSNLTDTSRVYMTQAIRLNAGQTYTFSTNLDTTQFTYIIHYLSSPPPVSDYLEATEWLTTSSYTFTPTEDCYFGLVIAKADKSSAIKPSEVSEYQFMLVKGTDTDYRPYNGAIVHEGDALMLGLADIYNESKNLFNNAMELGNINISTGIDQTDANRVRTVGYISVKPNTTYFFRRSNNVGAIGTRYYKSDKTYISSSAIIPQTGAFTTTFTTPADCYYIRFIQEITDTTATYTISIKGDIIYQSEVYNQHISGVINSESDISVAAGSTTTEKTLIEEVKTFSKSGMYLAMVTGYFYTSSYTALLRLLIDDEVVLQSNGLAARTTQFYAVMGRVNISQGSHSVKLELHGRGTMTVPAYHPCFYRLLKLTGDN